MALTMICDPDTNMTQNVYPDLSTVSTIHTNQLPNNPATVSCENINPVVILERLRIFPCERCQTAYFSSDDLNKHFLSHDNDSLNTSSYFSLNKGIFNTKVILKPVKMYKCRKCTKICINIEDYRLHKLKHLQQSLSKLGKQYNSVSGLYVKRYKCEECGLKFVQESTLSAHSILHTPFPHLCECGIGYYKREDLKAHRQLVHVSKNKYCTPKIKMRVSEKEIKTNTQNKIKKKTVKKTGHKPELILENSNSNLESNIEIHGSKTIFEQLLKIKTKQNEKPNIEIYKNEDNRFVCPECNKTFAAKDNVFKHLCTHTGEKLYQCDLCDKRFTQSGTLKLHLKRHTGIKDHFCEYCNKAFFNKAALSVHVLTHINERPYVCSYCNKGFNDPSAHKRHIRIHTGEKPYCCEHCPKKFSDASALIMHRKRHEAKKDQHCNICEKTFLLKTHLMNHLILHSRFKKYECNDCGKKFALKSYLVIHYKTVHFKQKNKEVFVCDYCGQKYSIKYNLMQHILQMHTLCVYCNLCMKPFLSDLELKMHKRKCSKINKKKAPLKNIMESEE